MQDEAIDAELLLNLSGTNNFEDALAQVAPNKGDDVVVVSYSEDEKIARRMTEFFLKEVGAGMQNLGASEGKLRNLAKMHNLKPEGGLSEEIILNLLVEESAMFYIRYR